VSLTIFRAEPDDAVPLHELAAATFALACPPDTTQASIDAFIALTLSTERFAEHLDDDARDIFLAVADGEPVGYTMIVNQSPTDADVVAAVTVLPTIELSKFYVLKGHHGDGVAAELMAATLEAARTRAAASVWLGVNQQNERANRFYEKHGFVTVGTKKFLVGDRWENDFVKSLVFD
jgi:ribosomal protein S18 acetylase RimI-like enzyme